MLTHLTTSIRKRCQVENARRSPPKIEEKRPEFVEVDSVSFTSAAEARSLKLPSWPKVVLLSVSLLGSGLQASQASAAAYTLQNSTRDLHQTIQEQLTGRDRRRALALLDSLEAKGLVSREFDLSRTATVGEQLQTLATQNLAKGIKRGKLIVSVLGHLDNPELVAQGKRGSCQVAAVQHLLASRKPSEYLRLVGGLSTPQGTVNLSNGDILTRAQDSIKDDSERDPASRLLQSAFIEYGNGPEIYDNRKDLSSGQHWEHLHEANPFLEGSGHQEGGHSGLYPNEMKRLIEAVFPGGAETVYAEPADKMAHVDQMAGALAKGQIVVVGLEWRDGMGHALAVKEIKNDEVIAWNPWGRDDPKLDRGPKREALNRTGLISMSRETLAKNLWVYQVGGKRDSR